MPINTMWLRRFGQGPQQPTTTPPPAALTTPTNQGEGGWPTRTSTNRFAPFRPSGPQFGGGRTGAQPWWQPQTGTTGTTTGTTTSQWTPPSTPMPEFEIPEEELRSMTQREAAPALRTARRGLREALTSGQSAATGPLRAYLMRQALEGFSGGIGRALGGARRYARGVLGERERARFGLASQAYLRSGIQRGTTTGTTTGVASRWGRQPGIYRPGQYRARGGPVTGKTPYVVGEEGPEVFVPGTKGTIIPNPGTRATKEPWYQNLLKPKRLQTPARSLI